MPKAVMREQSVACYTDKRGRAVYFGARRHGSREWMATEFIEGSPVREYGPYKTKGALADDVFRICRDVRRWGRAGNESATLPAGQTDTGRGDTLTDIGG